MPCCPRLEGWEEGGGAEEGDSVLEGWEEGRKNGRVEERGEIGCSIIATTGSRLEEVGGQMYTLLRVRSRGGAGGGRRGHSGTHLFSSSG